MVSDITANLKTDLKSLNSYGGSPTVEEERLFMVINNRYPFIVINGPYSDANTQIHNVSNTKLNYTIQYFVKYNDEDHSKSEITYVTRNVTGDIINKIMEDVTRGGFAIRTKITNFGNAFELISNRVEFFLYVVLEVSARLEATDPSLLG